MATSPYASMYKNPISFTDPDGDCPVCVAIGVGAAVGVFSNGLSNASQGQGFFQGAGKAALWGGISGAASFGVGSAATSLFGEGLSFGKAAFQVGAHGLSSGAQSSLQGGSFGQGFLSGGISSGLSSGASALNFGDAGMIGVAGLGGGIGSAIGGGNFFEGLGQGIAVGAFNHALHNSLSSPQADPPGFDYNGDGVVSWAEFALSTLEIGGYAFDIATIPSGEGAAFGLFIKGVGRSLAPKSWKLYSKATYRAFEKQLQQHGSKSIIKSRNKIQRRLQEHMTKLVDIQKNGGFSSSVHREINTYRSQLQAIDHLMGF